MEEVRWKLAENRVVAVRMKGNWENIYFITVLLKLHLA